VGILLSPIDLARLRSGSCRIELWRHQQADGLPHKINVAVAGMGGFTFIARHMVEEVHKEGWTRSLDENRLDNARASDMSVEGLTFAVRKAPLYRILVGW